MSAVLQSMSQFHIEAITDQLTSAVSGENPWSRPWWSMPTSWTTPQSDSRVLLSLDNIGLSWTASAPDKVTAVPVRRNGNSQTPTSVPAVRPKRCHILSNPAHWQDYMVACPDYTLQMMMPLPGWPVMAPECIRNNNIEVIWQAVESVVYCCRTGAAVMSWWLDVGLTVSRGYKVSPNYTSFYTSSPVMVNTPWL